MGICPWSKKRRNMKQKRRTISTDNEDEITKYLNECIVASSSKFEKIARHIVFAILASAWATVVAIDTPKYKYFFICCSFNSYNLLSHRIMSLLCYGTYK